MPRVYDVLYTRKQDNSNNRGNQMIERKELLEALMQMRDLDELRLIQMAVKDRIKEVGYSIKYALREGDEVNVNSSRREFSEKGIIKKVNRTRAVVLIEGKQWNVPFSLKSK